MRGRGGDSLVDGKAQHAGWRGGTGGVTLGQREEPPGSPRGGGAGGRTGRRAGAAGPRQGGARARQHRVAAWEPGLGRSRRSAALTGLSLNCSAGEIWSESPQYPTSPKGSSIDIYMARWVETEGPLGTSLPLLT